MRKIVKTINTGEILFRPIRPVGKPVRSIMQNLASTYHLELGRNPVGAQGTRVALRLVKPLRMPSNGAGTQEETAIRV